MAFIAVNVVEPLDFDLTPYGPKGTVPEPSDKTLMGFQTEMRKSLANKGISIDPGNPSAMTAAIAALDPETQTQFLDEQLHQFAGLCGGTPTLEQLQALPSRIRNAFQGWVMGQFNSPESSPAGTSG